MKKLFLLRHAKSSWEDSSLTDLERPLNKRGKRDAPFMGKLLKEKEINIDTIYTSHALRALMTAEIISKEIHLGKEHIIVEKKIYEAGIKELSDVVSNLPEKFSSVMIIGHNPGLTSFANFLGNKYIDNIPTCGIVGLKFNLESWNEIERGRGEIFLFEYPKKYLK
ncbi:SixA phosphatase family protein [Rosettibacter firmus]|uniref:SixA phosphatase family protein n=1 Tax=Rosettibacter firmus TaxID=3111522 RepID=UPI00336C1A1E